MDDESLRSRHAAVNACGAWEEDSLIPGTPSKRNHRGEATAGVHAKPSKLTAFFMLLASSFTLLPVAQATVAVSLGAPGWRYFAGGTDTSWNTVGFDDSSWQTGPAGLGFAAGEATTLPQGSIAYYFRLPFTVTEGGSFAFTARLQIDDGAAMYIDGVEARARINMPNGALGAGTLATSTISGTAESTVHTVTWDSLSIAAGEHILAVEVHQASSDSTDLFLDAALDYTVAPSPSPSLQAPITSLIPFGSTWQYLDTGSNLDNVNWRTATYDDSFWKTGTSMLGFNAEEATTVNPGVSGARHTIYVRKTFTVTEAEFADLPFEVSLQCDDGAVVYLNEVEVARRNMPSGLPGFSTLAATSFGPDEENVIVDYYNAPGALVAGENVLAISVHQGTATSSDILFEMSLKYSVLGSPSPAATASNSPTPTVSTTPTASTSEAPATPSPSTTPTATLSPSLTPSPAPASVTPSPSAVPAGMFLLQHATWKYLDTGVDLSTQLWKSPAFDDSAWGSGAAPLGYGRGDETTVVSFGSSAASVFPTTYFRTTATVTLDPTKSYVVRAFAVFDDGFVLNVNGEEALRANMPDGAVTSSTLASASIAGADSTRVFEYEVPATLFFSGANTIAVEVHQQGTASSDLRWQLSLVLVEVGSTPTATSTPAASPSNTPSSSPAVTPTPTTSPPPDGASPTPSTSVTAPPSLTPSVSATPAASPIPGATLTSTSTGTHTGSSTNTGTSTGTSTGTRTATPTTTPSPSPVGDGAAGCTCTCATRTCCASDINIDEVCADDSDDGFPMWGYVAIGSGALLALAATAFFVLRRRNKKEQPPLPKLPARVNSSAGGDGAGAPHLANGDDTKSLLQGAAVGADGSTLFVGNVPLAPPTNNHPLSSAEAGHPATATGAASGFGAAGQPETLGAAAAYAEEASSSDSESDEDFAGVGDANPPPQARPPMRRKRRGRRRFAKTVGGVASTGSVAPPAASPDVWGFEESDMDRAPPPMPPLQAKGHELALANAELSKAELAAQVEVARVRAHADMEIARAQADAQVAIARMNAVAEAEASAHVRTLYAPAIQDAPPAAHPALMPPPADYVPQQTSPQAAAYPAPAPAPAPSPPAAPQQSYYAVTPQPQPAFVNSNWDDHGRPMEAFPFRNPHLAAYNPYNAAPARPSTLLLPSGGGTRRPKARTRRASKGRSRARSAAARRRAGGSRRSSKASSAVDSEDTYLGARRTRRRSDPLEQHLLGDDEWSSLVKNVVEKKKSQKLRKVRRPAVTGHSGDDSDTTGLDW